MLLLKRRYYTSMRLHHLTSCRSGACRILCNSTRSHTDSLGSRSSLNEEIAKMFQSKDKEQSNAALSLFLQDKSNLLSPRHIAQIYNSASSVGQALGRRNSKLILQIIRDNKDKMQFTDDEIKEIFEGHRYMDDTNKDVRSILSEVLPRPTENRAILKSHRKLGLSLFGLQNMTVFHPELRKVLQALTYYVAHCPEPFDGTSMSGALCGTRSMSSAADEVIHFIRVITKKFEESKFKMSPAGISRCINSLQCKSDRKSEVIHLLAALNLRMEAVCHRMTATEVCRALHGLQSMSAETPTVENSIAILTNRFGANEVQKYLTPRDLALALGGLKTMGCSTERTTLLVNALDNNIEMLVDPIMPRDLVIAFSGLKNMRSSQLPVPSLLSSLTNNMLLLSRNEVALPSFMFPSTLKFLTKMNSAELAVRNFLFVMSDLLDVQDHIHFTSTEFALCISGLRSMNSSEPAVQRFLSSVLKKYSVINNKDAGLEWEHVCMILEGMSCMNNDTDETKAILEIIAQRIKNLKNDSNINLYLLSSAMSGMRNMNEVDKSEENVRCIYTGLFELFKERSFAARSNLGLGKKIIVALIGSLSALSPAISENMHLLTEVMSFTAEAVRSNRTNMAAPFENEMTQCLQGISSSTKSNVAADNLLRAFLYALPSKSVSHFENDIRDCMSNMRYSNEEIEIMVHDMINREVIGDVEMNEYFKKSISLPERLKSLQNCIKECESGDSFDILWSSNVLKQIIAHKPTEYSVHDISILVQSCSEFSQLFFSKYKREAIPLRNNFIELTSSILRDATDTYTSNFDDYFAVLSATQCLWKNSGSTYGGVLLSDAVQSLQKSSLSLNFHDTARIMSFLKRTNSNHMQVRHLLDTVNSKIVANCEVDLATPDFIDSIRGMRYLLNEIPRARFLFNKFVQLGKHSNITLSMNEIKIGMCGMKNVHNAHKEIAEALDFFTRQLETLGNTDNFEMLDLTYLLSCLRYMNSSDKRVQLVIDEIQSKFPSDLSKADVNAELLCNFIQFFNHKRCKDTPSILNLRNSFISLIDLSQIADFRVFSLKIVEHLIALKSKRSNDADLGDIYHSIAKDIISLKYPEEWATPNLYCMGLLGFDSLVISKNVAGINDYCRRLDDCKKKFSFQIVMLSLSALETSYSPQKDKTGLDQALSSLCKKLSDSPPSRIIFSTLLSAFHSLGNLSVMSDATLSFYPILSGFLEIHSLSHHRIARLIKTMVLLDSSKPEVQELANILLVRLRELNIDKLQKVDAVSMINSFEKMDENSRTLQSLKNEVISQLERSGVAGTIKTVTEAKEALKGEDAA